MATVEKKITDGVQRTNISRRTDRARRLRGLTLLAALIVISLGASRMAEAQSRVDCRSPLPPSVGAAVGRSSPYVDLARDAVDGSATSGSVMVRSGAQFVGRAELPVVGPLRLRVEGATARWDVRRESYDPQGNLTADTSVGHMSARHLVALPGVRVGRPGACAHVSAGGGFYALGFRNASVSRPGAALAAGIELPTGNRGAIQLDGVLHLIATRDAHPIAGSTVPVLNLLVGWAYRF